MAFYHNDENINYAKDLRKNMTDEERHLWYDFLKSCPAHFYRQRPIGNYIVDFYCPDARLVIELDGSQHYEPEAMIKDEERTTYLKSLGLEILRIPNNSIKDNFCGVCEYIDSYLTSQSACADSSPMRGATVTLPHIKENTMKTVDIYTDGACSGNPGPGGWGAILMYGGHKRELSGGEAMTTNNRMELTGVIRALQALKEPCIVELWSDSKYVIDALEKGWAVGWRARGWKKADKKPALNIDLWETLLDLAETHQLRCHWVKGHAENEYNNRCDQLAVMERERFA